MNVITIATLCLAALCGGGDEKDKPKLEVRVKVATLVRGLDVTVGELCEITPAGKEAVALSKVAFGPAPTAGHTRIVSRTEIVQALAAAGHDVGALKFAGSTEVTVQPVVVEVPIADLLDSATSALQAVLAIEGGDVEIEAPVRLRQVQAPPGRTSQELVARVRGNRTSPEAAIVDVEVMVDGACSKRVPVPFKLTRYQQVLKTTGAIRAGTPLGADNLTIAREPVVQATGMWLNTLDQVQGLNAARNLQANARITLGDAAPPAVIRRGDVVTVVLTQGRVKVTAKAIANHDAALGARATLTNLSSRTALTGTVAAPGLVIVQK